MQAIVITLAMALAVVLIHFSYVDFRFRYREGVAWFWRLSPAPPLMWLARMTFAAAFLAALATPFFGSIPTAAYVVVGLMVLHIVSLVLLEVLEPR